MFKKTVTTITAGLNKMADELEALSNKCVDECGRHHQTITDTQEKINGLADEATKADKIAANIRTLLNV
jgi:hypothetical protein